MMTSTKNPVHISLANTLTSEVPALGGLLVAISLMDVIFGLYISLILLSGWRLYAFIGSILFETITTIAMLAYLNRGLKNAAGIFFVIGFLQRSLSTALFFDSTGVLMQLLLLIVSGIVVIEWLHGSYVKWVIPGVFIASIVVLFFDLLDLPWQTSSLSVIKSYTVLIGFFILLFVLFTILKFRTYSIRYKLILVLLGLSASVVLGLAAATNQVVQNTTTNEARTSLTSSATNLASSLDRFISYSLQSLQSLAANPDIYQFLELPENQRLNTEFQAEIINLLYGFLLRNPTNIDTYSLYDSAGINVADTNSARIGVNHSYQSHFVVPVYSGFSYVSLDYSSKSLADSRIIFSTPVRNDNDEIVGVMSVQYKLGFLQKLIERTNNLAGDQSYAILVDEYDHVIGHGTEPELIGESIFTLVNEKSFVEEDNESSGFHIFKISAEMPSNQGLASSTFDESDTEARNSSEMAVAVTHTTTQPWKVLFLQSQSVFMAPIQTQNNVVIVISEMIALFVILAGSVGANIFSKPILALTQAVQELAQGNLHAEVTIMSQDEVGQLAESFNQMAGQLSETLSILENRVQARTRAIETASQIGYAIASILDPNLLIKEVIEQLTKAFHYNYILIYLVDQMNDQLVLIGCNNEVDEALSNKAQTLPFGQGFAGQAALNLKTYFSQDTRQDKRWTPNPLAPDSLSEIATPILFGDELLGVLDVQHRTVAGINQQDVSLLELISGQIAIALNNARQYQKAQKQADIQSRLNQIMDRIRATTSVEEALSIAIEEISDVIPSSKIMARLYLSGNKEDWLPGVDGG